jgi:hypothetical protein
MRSPPRAQQYVREQLLFQLWQHGPATARACSLAETPAVRGLDFFTRVAAVHLRQTILKLMGRQGGRARVQEGGNSSDHQVVAHQRLAARWPAGATGDPLGRFLALRAAAPPS